MNNYSHSPILFKYSTVPDATYRLATTQGGCFGPWNWWARVVAEYNSGKNEKFWAKNARASKENLNNDILLVESDSEDLEVEEIDD